jgi:hypothetical protein
VVLNLRLQTGEGALDLTGPMDAGPDQLEDSDRPLAAEDRLDAFGDIERLPRRIRRFFCGLFP